MAFMVSWEYAWLEKWKLPGTLSISKIPTILHPLFCFRSSLILYVFCAEFMWESVYISVFSGRMNFFICSWILVAWSLRLFWMSNESMEQGTFGNSMSILTLHDILST